MPVVSKVQIHIPQPDLTWSPAYMVVTVNAQGQFYIPIPEHIFEAINQFEVDPAFVHPNFSKKRPCIVNSNMDRCISASTP